MNQRTRRYVVAVAILLCLVLLLVPHSHFANAAVCLVLIPELFFGIPVSPRLLSRMAYLRVGELPEAPALPSSFQRPPPSLLA
jgi:hypothetical protein